MLPINLLKISDWADLRVALGKSGRFEYWTLANGPNADVPLLLTQWLLHFRWWWWWWWRRRRRRRRCCCCCCTRCFLLADDSQWSGTGRRGRRRQSQLIGVAVSGCFGRGVARFRPADFPRRTKLFDCSSHLARSHAQVVAPPTVEIAAKAAQAPLKRRRHRHFQEALTIPQQFHSYSKGKDKRIYKTRRLLRSSGAVYNWGKGVWKGRGVITEIGADDDTVALLDDRQNAQTDERKWDPFMVHFHLHILTECHFQIFNLNNEGEKIAIS